LAFFETAGVPVLSVQDFWPPLKLLECLFKKEHYPQKHLLFLGLHAVEQVGKEERGVSSSTQV
jgi:hypothetical protein